jgi:hypothetical protein
MLKPNRSTDTEVENQKNGLTLTLPSDREIVITRAFNAPRKLVFCSMD